MTVKLTTWSFHNLLILMMIEKTVKTIIVLSIPRLLTQKVRVYLAIALPHWGFNLLLLLIVNSLSFYYMKSRLVIWSSVASFLRADILLIIITSFSEVAF